jgi:L-galactose dehydrogenase
MGEPRQPPMRFSSNENTGGSPVPLMQYRPLGNTGMKVSVIGYGASPLGNEFGPADFDEGVRAVHAAIDRGVNFFDVSPYYGRTLAEERLGRALDGRRDLIILATKIGRYGREPDECDYSAARVFASVEGSLQRLRTDYIDLLQVHDVENVADPRQIIDETIPAMRKLQRQGKCRAVGITGLPLKILRYIAERAPVNTILSFCRYNLMIDDMDELLTPFCREKEIGLINAAPLHMRLLAAAGPPDWHPALEPIRAAARRIIEICRRAGVDVADVALRFCLDHPYTSSVIIGMARQREVEQNVATLETKNDPDLLRAIAGAVAPVKNQIWMQGRPENNDANWTRGT